MNRLNLGILTTPTTFTIVWASTVWILQSHKKRVNEEQIYQDLKSDTVEVYKQSIDESKNQPLLDLLKQRRTKLDPELRKRLEVLEEWKRDNMWTYAYNYTATVVPAFFGAVFFPRSTAWIMAGLSILSQINYYNDREIMSGGKQKSYMNKNILPKQDKLLDGFAYISYTIMFLSLLKLGLIRYNRSAKSKILNDWRKSHQKK